MTLTTNIKSLPDFKIIPYNTNTSPSAGQQPQPQPPLKLLRTSSWIYYGPLLPLKVIDENTQEYDDTQFPPSYHTWHSATITSNLSAKNILDQNFYNSSSSSVGSTSSDASGEGINSDIRGEKLIKYLHPFLSFAHEFIKSAGLEHYWLTIRATLPNEDFNTPRWHTDDDFFQGGSRTMMGSCSSGDNCNNKAHRHHYHPHNNNKGLKTDTDIKGNKWNLNLFQNTHKEERTQWKLVSTLLGPGTLFQTNNPTARSVQRSVKEEFKNSPDHTCTSITCLGCASTAENVRAKLAERLKNTERIQAQIGECCFLKVGTGNGAVHSEPRMDGGERVFVNIIPGKEEELREVMGRWGMEEYPRAWSLGVPLGFDLTL
ncbi:hypothetical protein TWF694_006950 [Orbilia ellipsospora]|uniref:Clavaminate synthase-like protein n=1 Tax=Orbilia ellipsospora TaxID=2528407 RepID=A0AAV9XLQ4_9PEZI